MPELTVDVSQVKSFEPIPEGRYLVRFDSYKVVTSKGAKTEGIPALNVTFLVDEEGEYKDRRLWSYMLLAGEYAFTIKGFLSAVLGEAPEGPLSIDPDKFIGVKVYADVSIDTNAEEDGGDGNPRNRIEAFHPIEGDGAEGGDGGLKALFD